MLRNKSVPISLRPVNIRLLTLPARQSGTALDRVAAPRAEAVGDRFWDGAVAGADKLGVRIGSLLPLQAAGRQ